jgi:hypothetical protein
MLNYLDARLLDAFNEAIDIMKKDLHYNPTYFIRMLQEDGPVETSIQLINSPHLSEGYTKLWEYCRLELSVEAICIQEEFRELFSPTVIKNAEKRLKETNYLNRSKH